MQMYPGWSSRQNYSQGKKKKRNRDKTQDGGTYLPAAHKAFPFKQLRWCVWWLVSVCQGECHRQAVVASGTPGWMAGSPPVPRHIATSPHPLMVLNVFISFTLNLFIIVNFYLNVTICLLLSFLLPVCIFIHISLFLIIGRCLIGLLRNVSASFHFQLFITFIHIYIYI